MHVIAGISQRFDYIPVSCICQAGPDLERCWKILECLVAGRKAELGLW